MKAKLKKFKIDKEIVIGAPKWDGSVVINGRKFEQGNQYEITEEEFDTQVFNIIKEKKEDE